MFKLKLIPILSILFILSACSLGILGTDQPIGTSGIEGHVLIGPMCPGPIEIGSTACADQPYQAKITVLDENNKRITQFTTDSNGYFKVSLNPGNYILHPESGEPFPVAADQPVSVTENNFTQLTIQFDTGMR